MLSHAFGGLAHFLCIKSELLFSSPTPPTTTPTPPHKKKKKSKPLFYFNESFQKPKILTFEPFYDIQVEGKGMEPINQNFYLSF